MVAAAARRPKTPSLEKSENDHNIRRMTMKTLPTLAMALALSLATTGMTLADDRHGHGAPASGAETRLTDAQLAPMAGGQADMMSGMMQSMMRMHAQMMGGGMPMIGGPGGMAGMDRDMMQMMMSGDMMGSGMAGTQSAADSGSTMRARLAEFDADGDGNLSLAEFETLHAAMIRELTVDRFQHLDADGDGLVTADEMGAPARRMEMRGMPDGAAPMMGGTADGSTGN
jgi:hypothetical protein